MNASITEFYSRPQYGGGGFFVGQRLPQVGGSFLGGIGRFLLPILKTVGKNLLGIGVKAADDVIQRNVPIKDALLSNTRNRVEEFINNRGGKRRKIQK